MAIIQFGEWVPDQPRLGNRCITAQNALPVSNGYAPFPGPSADTDALVAACVGAVSFKEVDGTVQTFAGTATKLYQLNGTSWTDVSKAGGTYTSSTFWRFAVYGDLLIATNGTDTPQKFDVTSSSEFADLGGSPPVHNYPIVIRETLVALDCASGSEIQWSATNDAEQWEAACGGGSQPVVDGGPIKGGTGGEYGTVLQEQGLTRMNFVGGDLRFTFDKIEGTVGCIAADSVVQHKGLTYFLSEEGFQVFDGAQSQNISDEKVTNTFFDELTYSSVSSVRGANDVRNSSIIWSYPISGGRKLIGYNYRLQRWFDATSDVDCLHLGFTSSGQFLSAFDSADKLARFDGDPLAAKLSTGDIQIAKERNAQVKSVIGLIDAASYDVTVGSKDRQNGTETLRTNAVGSNGRASIRSRGRYHRFQIDTTDTNWTECNGVDVEATRADAR